MPSVSPRIAVWSKSIEVFDDIRRVEPPAHTDLEDDNVAFLLGEPKERRCRDQLENGCALVHLIRRFADLFHGFREFVVGDIFAVELDALVKAVDVGRGIEPGFIAGCLEDVRHHA